MNQLLKLKFFVLLSMLYFGGTINSFGQTKWADWSFTPAGYNFMTSTPTPPSFNGSFSGPGVTSISMQFHQILRSFQMLVGVIKSQSAEQSIQQQAHILSLQ
ncbi:MAG: hypothetical protein ACK4XL_01070 [Bacteroidota bacterium]